MLFAAFDTSTLCVVAGSTVFRLSNLYGISDTSDMTAASCGPESAFGLSQRIPPPAHGVSDDWETATWERVGPSPSGPQLLALGPEAGPPTPGGGLAARPIDIVISSTPKN